MKILIATDGSEYSRAAIEKCCEIAVKAENDDWFGFRFGCSPRAVFRAAGAENSFKRVNQIIIAIEEAVRHFTYKLNH